MTHGYSLCEYVMCVWGGVKGATDKHFRKRNTYIGTRYAMMSILNGKTPAIVQPGRFHGSRVRAWR